MSYEFFKGLSPVDRAKALRARRKKWGKIGAGHAHEVEQLVEDLLAVVESYEGGLTKEEATKLRRQLGAANARVARQSNRAGALALSPQDDDGDED